MATAKEPAGVRRLRFDVGRRPFLVLLELTRACALACRHCRAEASPRQDPDELRSDEVRGILDDLADLGPPRPIVVLTGGDPLERSDLADLVRYGTERRLAVAVSPAGTPRASRARLEALRRAGARTVSFSLDGPDAPSHDAFRKVAGSFAWTLAGCRAARAAGLRLQVNTTVSAATVRGLPALCRLVDDLGADLWSVFFLVPVGRGRDLGALSAAETEDVLAFLADAAGRVPLKTTEAPAFRRLLDERAGAGTAAAPGPLYDALSAGLEEAFATSAAPARPSPPRRPPLAVGDGRGVVFVSCHGEVQPSGFLPLVAGNVRNAPLTEIYARSSLLRAIRDPGALRGRCGDCSFRDACGGSRAQAFARSGDPLGEDPTCTFDPVGAAW